MAVGVEASWVESSADWDRLSVQGTCTYVNAVLLLPAFVNKPEERGKHLGSLLPKTWFNQLASPPADRGDMIDIRPPAHVPSKLQCATNTCMYNIQCRQIPPSCPTRTVPLPRPRDSVAPTTGIQGFEHVCNSAFPIQLTRQCVRHLL